MMIKLKSTQNFQSLCTILDFSYQYLSCFCYQFIDNESYKKVGCLNVNSFFHVLEVFIHHPKVTKFV